MMKLLIVCLQKPTERLCKFWSLVFQIKFLLLEPNMLRSALRRKLMTFIKVKSPSPSLEVDVVEFRDLN